MSPDQSPEPAKARPDQAMAQAGEVVWQLTFAVFTAWCDLMSPTCLTEQPHSPHRDEHEQLIVPEPLEEASERALFA